MLGGGAHMSSLEEHISKYHYSLTQLLFKKNDWPSWSLKPLNRLMHTPTWYKTVLYNNGVVTCQKDKKYAGRTQTKIVMRNHRGRKQVPGTLKKSGLWPTKQCNDNKGTGQRHQGGLLQRGHTSKRNWTPRRQGKKMNNLVKRQNKALVHPAPDNLEAYATDSFPENCVPDWSTDQI